VDARFAEYVGGRWRPLVRYAAVVTGDPAEAADIVRKVLIKVGVCWPLVRRRDDLDGYVRAAILRTHLDDWRRQRVAVGTAPAPLIAPYDETLDLEAEPTVLDALRQLPPRQRAALAVRFLDQRSLAETAALLRADADTIGRDVTESLRTLRRRFPALRDADDLLQAAGTDADRRMPEPPVAAVQRSAIRRVAAGAATTALAAGVVAAAVAVTSGHPTGAIQPHPTTAPAAGGRAPGIVRTWDVGGPVSGVASGLGAVWVGRGLVGVELGPQGAVVKTITPATVNGRQPVRDVTVGAGRLWLLSRSRQGASTVITGYRPNRLNPTSSGEATFAFVGGPASFAGAAFDRGSLWLPEKSQGRVVRLTPAGDRVDVFSERVAGRPSSLATDATGKLWLYRARDHELTQVRFHGDQPEFSLGRSVGATADVLGTGPGAFVWTTSGSQLEQLWPEPPRASHPITVLWRTHGRPLQVAESAVGAFVATSDGVDYFSNHTLQSEDSPTAFFPARGLTTRSIAAYGNGVVVATGDAHVTQWIPEPGSEAVTGH
jgi:RNA polymerase sigma factor (sigma-70 family)